MKLKFCTIHPHSSQLRALKCWFKSMRRKGDRAYKNHVHIRPVVVNYTHPRKTVHGKIEMLIFSEDVRMPY